ncbi:hypothetical protein OF83DRAFT_262241 [Amylostereum chailletii]|nr:hypothetical protein OF83DRAFT_262241 [Amylostereum chailletii]
MTSETSTPSLIGLAAALAARADTSITIKPQIFNEFSQKDRVALVTGANRGLGLESALVLLEAGARAVYCVDLPKTPGEEWTAVKAYVDKMGTGGRIEYLNADVTDQQTMWDIGKTIGDKEGRLDVCVAAAGIASSGDSCLDYTADDFRKPFRVNTDGVVFTAQSAGRQMVRFGTGGSIILIASIAGSVAFDGTLTFAYSASKGAVLQVGRSMACELAPKGIRVNTVSPGFTTTALTAAPTEVHDLWSSQAPLKRLARSSEMRGVVAWLASDASTFCTGSDIKVDGGYTSW